MRTLTVGKGLAGGTIDFAAEVRARVESRVGFRVAGKMIAREVGVGDSVKAGQVLARLDPLDLQLGQQAARATTLAARVNRDQARTDFERFAELRGQGFISAADLERREASLKAAQAQFEQAEALAALQGNQARYSSLVADTAGVVTAVEAEAGAVLTSGATVMRIAHDGPRDVVFSVPEDQVGALRALLGRPGSLQVRLWGASGPAHNATLRELAAAADPSTRTFLAKADVGKAEVRLGQTATVSLPMPTLAAVVKVPLGAVFEQQGQSSVWVLDPATMTVHAKPIKVAGAEGNLVLVAAGLEDGQHVVSAGVHTLTPGQKVARYGQTVAAGSSQPQP